MDENKLDLETLERVKRICDIQSDMSSRTLGYFWVCKMIENLTCASQNASKSDEALPIADVVKSDCDNIDVDTTGLRQIDLNTGLWK